LDAPVFRLTSSPPSGRRLAVAGELDLAASSDLRAALTDVLDGGSDVAVDLSAVTFIDSTALAVLVHACAEAAVAGTRMVVINPSPVVLRILQLSGLLTMLDIEGSAG
jgi:anti-sigma B factor antagonist